MARKKSKKPSHDKDPRTWTVFSLVAALLGATVAKRAVNTTWRAATGKQPPANPADPDVDVWEAVAWAAVSGTIVAIARMLASRRAAHYYARSTGQLPPSLRKDDQHGPEQGAGMVTT
ncbi:MAG TPA: DUF4235 domain-containing protein [Marmoricola sp.]|jgi:hypothetical protein|nr:DUF4235 domain-containing protein [Marmoricola sp.]